MSAERVIFLEALEQATASWSFTLSTAQKEQLAAHYEAMIEYNRKVNLTRITDPVEAAVKHYADSLSVLAWVEQQGLAPRSLLDIGTGAGFPAIPLAVVRPEWEVAALEATGKKVAFLEGFAKQAGLPRFRVEHAHSAHWKTRRRFDLVALKAVGSLRECFEQGARFLAVKGQIVVFKTASMPAEEIHEAEACTRENGLIFAEPFDYSLECRGELFRRRLCVAS